MSSDKELQWAGLEDLIDPPPKETESQAMTTLISEMTSKSTMKLLLDLERRLFDIPLESMFWYDQLDHSWSKMQDLSDALQKAIEGDRVFQMRLWTTQSPEPHVALFTKAELAEWGCLSSLLPIAIPDVIIAALEIRGPGHDEVIQFERERLRRPPTLMHVRKGFNPLRHWKALEAQAKLKNYCHVIGVDPRASDDLDD
jgi:hypothetical protein